MKNCLGKASVVTLVVFLIGCAGVPSPAQRAASAEALAQAKGWQKQLIQTDDFEVVAYVPLKYGVDPHLTIYIEGDGYAWVTGSQPSDDPTPRDPLALRLALAQPEGNAAYLARPCQFAMPLQCAQRYWTNQRFATEVVNASDKALGQIKTLFGAERLTLVGYSGGGTVAALLAQRRQDVDRLITVAGNLDHRAWTAYHHVPPLIGSLNPADFTGLLANLPQLHLVGNDDRIVTPELARAWPIGFAGPNNKNVRVVLGFDHRCCWAEQWPRLWATAR